MKVLFKLLIISITTVLSTNSYAFPEMPFCPAGGPPGWMNRIIHNHDRNTWHHNSRYAPQSYQQPYYYRPNYAYSPVYRPDQIRQYRPARPQYTPR